MVAHDDVRPTSVPDHVCQVSQDQCFQMSFDAQCRLVVDILKLHNFNVTLRLRRCDYKSLIVISTVFKVWLVKMDLKATSRRPLPVIGKERKDVWTWKKRTLIPRGNGNAQATTMKAPTEVVSQALCWTVFIKLKATKNSTLKKTQGHFSADNSTYRTFLRLQQTY